VRRVPLAVAAALAVAGCGSSDSGQSTDTVPTESAPAAKKPENLVVVHETEFRLDPANVSGGSKGLVRIKVVNDGKIAHALAVEGPNGRVDLDGSLEPGESATMEVDLDKPGTYTWFCPLGDHRAKGMTGTITVGGDAPARGSEDQSTTVTRTTPTQTTTQTQTQTHTQTQTQTVTTPSRTQTDTTPTATTGTTSPY
jgi:PQQ system protein